MVYSMTLRISSSPGLDSVFNIALVKSIDSPTPLVQSLSHGMYTCAPFIRWKHTLFPYWDSTISLLTTDWISSSVKFLELVSCHLAAYCLSSEKMLLIIALSF